MCLIISFSEMKAPKVKKYIGLHPKYSEQGIYMFLKMVFLRMNNMIIQINAAITNG